MFSFFCYIIIVILFGTMHYESEKLYPFSVEHNFCNNCPI